MIRANHSAKTKIPFWVVLVCLATLVFGIADHGLWTPDEPREAEIAREMSLGTSLIIPRLVGKPFVEKPPLYYWLSALMMRSAGKFVGATAAARALSALGAALTLLVSWWVLRKYLGRDRALAVTIILVTTAGFFYAAHRVIIDPLLMFLTCAAILLLFYGLDQEKPLSLWGGYAAAGLAFLAKGFVAWGMIALPWIALLIIYYRVIIRHYLLNLVGLLLLFGPPIAWMIALYSKGGPELWREWFLENQVGRFLGRTDHLGHIRGPFYYLPLLPAMLMPWMPVIIGWVVHRRWRRMLNDRPGTRNLLLVTIAWSFGNFLLLSLAGTKRDIYLFPLLPGFAVFAAAAIGDWKRWEKIALKFICLALVLFLIVFSFGRLVWISGKIRPEFGVSLPVLICAIAAALALHRYRNRTLAAVAGITGLFYLGAVFAVVPFIDLSKDYGPAARLVARAIPPGEESRVCGWHLDETTEAIFSYHTGFILHDIYDGEDLPGSIRSLELILNGKDPRFHSIITYTRKGRSFPPEGVLLEANQILAREKMGVNRTVFLIISKELAGRSP